MNKPDTQTETVTRTETVTDTVTKAACPVCEQRVDSAELVSVEIGTADDATGCCRYCAQALFGYEGEPDGAETAGDTSARRDRIVAALNPLVATLDAQSKQLVKLMTGLITFAVVGLVATQVATEASAQMATNPIQDVGAPPLFELADLFPLVLIAFTAWLVVKAMVVGPRP